MVHIMPSIYDYIKQQTGPTLAPLSGKSLTLPDEERFYIGKEGPRYAAGAIDGIMTHHMARFDRDEELIDTIVGLLLDLSEQLNMDTINKLEEKLESIQMMVAYIDPIIEQLAEKETAYYPNLHQVARQLTFFAKKRNSVKLGISLLRFSDYPEDMEPVFILGLHDEFTIYSMLTFLNYYEDPTPQMYEMAKRVNGWGRIHLVEKLAENNDLPANICDWMLREGFRNTVMNEYLALPVATSAKLDAILSRDSVDEELMQSAAELLLALFEEGPVAGISAYGKREKTFAAFRKHADGYQGNTKIQEAVKKIDEYTNSTALD